MSDSNGSPLSAAEIKAKQLAGPPLFAAVFLEGVGPVRVYSMTSAQLTAFNKESRRRRKVDADRVREAERLIVACLRDTEGHPVYTAADEDALSDLPAGTMRRVITAALKVNGLSDDDEDDAGN